ncbi:hypothetical protein NDU88_000808 [Pleurodeles waltl]|uniref:Uncharacterized protein n=1 Tax=Pleurodeles waltl TaxID=8319 RepID=A0AAV7MN35_PLEWA|nr:hypothetical protein NDU88_000807 [Pleurodeles waltl]KAJ1103384.1 hypothetical protein NDU88_000808 [Pleurodeles waltl]
MQHCLCAHAAPTESPLQRETLRCMPERGVCASEKIRAARSLCTEITRTDTPGEGDTALHAGAQAEGGACAIEGRHAAPTESPLQRETLRCMPERGVCASEKIRPARSLCTEITRTDTPGEGDTALHAGAQAEGGACAIEGRHAALPLCTCSTHREPAAEGDPALHAGERGLCIREDTCSTVFVHRNYPHRHSWRGRHSTARRSTG